MKTHLLEYLEQHRRLEEALAGRQNELDKQVKKSDVKHKLQEFVLQKKQREILNNANNSLASSSQGGGEEAMPESSSSMVYSESESDAEVSSLLSSNPSYFKALPRISPVQEDEGQPVGAHNFSHSPRSSRSIASPGSLGSSSSSLLEEARGGYSLFNNSPPRHGKLRPVGRTQSAPLPLAHPSLLAPPEVRQGKTSPELELAAHSPQHLHVKQQIRHSLLTRHHRGLLQGDASNSLDPMLAMAELSQIQVPIDL